jgi:hypothetical protein
MLSFLSFFFYKIREQGGVTGPFAGEEVLAQRDGGDGGGR